MRAPEEIHDGWAAYTLCPRGGGVSVHSRTLLRGSDSGKGKTEQKRETRSQEGVYPGGVAWRARKRGGQQQCAEAPGSDGSGPTMTKPWFPTGSSLHIMQSGLTEAPNI